MATFDQRDQRVNTQYNAGGDIKFGSRQIPTNLVTELEELKHQIAQATEDGILPEDTAIDADYQITKALQQAKKPEPEKKTILKHLTTTKALLENIATASGLVTALVGAIPSRAENVLMSDFNQQGQRVETQYNSENIIINMMPSAPAPRVSLLWHVPYRRNPFFTGREDSLQQLHDALTTTKNVALTQAISGLGGIGKTQTALEYTYRYHHEYHSIFWVRANSREEILEDFTQIARIIQISDPQEHDQQRIFASVTSWLQSHTNWLLIVDNADDLNMVQAYLPTHTSGRILLTTRAQAVRSLARKVELTTLPPEESVLFLLRRAGLMEQDENSLEHVDWTRHATAKTIAEALGHLPLALDQAGAYLEETGTSLTNYLALYQQERKTLLARRGGLTENHVPVATTWSLAFDKLAISNPAAIDLMRLCAFLAPDIIAEEILTQGAHHMSDVLQQAASSTIAWNCVIEDLGKYSLVHRQSETHTLSLHRLVQSVLYDEMDALTRHSFANVALNIVSEVFPFNEIAPWRKSQRYITNALTCLEFVDQFQVKNKEARYLRFNVAAYFYSRGQYLLAQSLYEQVLSSQEQQLGLEHPETLGTRHNLATLYSDQGKHEQAQSLYEQVLSSREKQLGSEHPETLSTRHNLAILYSSQGKHEQAQSLYEQVLSSREKQLGSEHPLIMRTRLNLAVLYAKQSKHEQAQYLFEQVLSSREKQLGPEHPETLRTRLNLAATYAEQSKYKQAQPLFEQVLNSYEQQLGPEHPETLKTRHNLANLYSDQGNIEQAQILFEKVLSSREQQLGPQHPDTLNTRNALAILNSKQNKVK